jgi:pyruvate dehydrogenase E2 component (dihydrolipoamide acetyltransferase)
MAEPTAVLVPRENVNDEVVILVRWHVQPGDRVADAQLLAEIETSKTVLEIQSPRPGFVHHWHPAGGEIAVGETLCLIADEPVAAASPTAQAAATASRAQRGPAVAAVAPGSSPPAPDRGPAASPASRPTALTEPDGGAARPAAVSLRLSAAAAEFARRHAIAPESLAGRGLVRVRDLAAAADATSVAASAPRPPASTATSQLAAGVPVTREPLPRRKAQEIRTLAGGAAGALPSWVSITCPTRGLRRLAAARPELQGNATALIVFEAARLLRRFPVFNASFDDGGIGLYSEVNVGFAVDAGHGLKVPVIQHADTKPLATIAVEMQRAVFHYLEDSLPLESLARGTFCVSDLSGEEVTSFLPLVSAGQSAILGVGAEIFPVPGGPGSYELVLAFDHRVAEGRVAGQFLRALRDRLVAHEATLGEADQRAADRDAAHDGEVPASPSCGRCGRGVAEIDGLGGFLVASSYPRGHLCSICLGGF